VRNARSVAVDGRIGGHDSPRFADGLPGRYGHRLLPSCCPTSLTVPGWTLRLPSDGWAALKRVRARAETAPAAPGHGGPSSAGTEQHERRCSGWTMDVGRRPPDLKSPAAGTAKDPGSVSPDPSARIS
jgi:hypothetical protein